MLLRTEDGSAVEITQVHFGDGPDEIELVAGFYVDTDIPLSPEELDEIRDANFDLLLDLRKENA